MTEKGTMAWSKDRAERMKEWERQEKEGDAPRRVAGPAPEPTPAPKGVIPTTIAQPPAQELCATCSGMGEWRGKACLKCGGTGLTKGGK